MTVECLRPVDVQEFFTHSISGRESLELIVEMAEQLEPEQLDSLVARIDKLRLEKISAESAVTRQLTAREQQVLVLVARGYNRKKIGRTLSISASTAAKHISNIYRKLGVSTIAEATRMALV